MAPWNGALGQRYTLGVEEEVMLLVPDGWPLAQSSDGVFARIPGDLLPPVSPETPCTVREFSANARLIVSEPPG